MATIRELREGLAANLATTSGVQVSPYVLASPTPPSIDVLPARISYYQAMGNAVEMYVFNVQATVTAGIDQGAQMALDEFVDSGAVRAALESDRTLGGKASSLIVRELTEYGRSVNEGAELFIARWEVEVWV
jgi:hypothetical protein